MTRAASAIRDWLAFHVVILASGRLPRCIWWALLPYAGNWAYRHERARAVGLEGGGGG
jgi:hypothetical protein